MTVTIKKENPSKQNPRRRVLKRYVWSLVFLVVSLMILPYYVFLQTRLHLMSVAIKKENSIYEQFYEKNSFLRNKIRKSSSKIWQDFSKMGLKKILAKDIPIVIFKDDSSLD